MAKRLRLSRRALLKGAGVALGLPLLEAMGSPAWAQAATPRRFVTCFGGYSLGTDQDHGPNVVVPDTTGPLRLGARPATAPLAPVQDHVTLVSGLSVPISAIGAPTPPGGRSAGVESFHYHVNPLLSGHRQVGDPFDTTVTGPSADQIAARAIGGQTRFDSLTFRAQAAAYGGDLLNRGTLSFREMDGRVVPVQPDVSPWQAYQSLVVGIEPGDPQAAHIAQMQLSRRKSVLDLVDRRMGGLIDRLGRADRQRLQQHYDELRALEVRLERPPVPTGGGCFLTSTPPDPDIDISRRYSGELARGRRFAELIRMAFACDLTRVATLMFTFWQSRVAHNAPAIEAALAGSEARAFDGTEFHTILHEHSHTDLARGIAWHMDLFAHLLTLLRETPEADSTLLDHCAIVYLNEGGYGAAEAGVASDDHGKFTSHSTDNMVALVAGGAGGLQRGVHIVSPEGRDHPVNVQLTALKAAGVSVDQMGDVSGIIDALLP
ncbi:MAG: DUF1552 domain-containing protein [Bradymonadia bacterium]